MNPDVKVKWLNLLRSGKYAQGHGQLGVDPLYTDEEGTKPERCCLGVLCEVAVEEGVIQKKVNPYGNVIYGVNLDDPNVSKDTHTGSDYEAAQYYLPTPVRTWAGLDPEVYAPRVSLPDDVHPESQHDIYEGKIGLATLNDSVGGYDLTKIADAIESSDL